MITIALENTVTATPDFSGWRFFVEAGQEFDADVYADAYRINRFDIDDQDIKAAQDAAAGLNPGEWLEVTHTVSEQE